jgi:S-adenosylmethionine-diacylglycerol 3-amino-3-carboxypropyl transferase
MTTTAPPSSASSAPTEAAARADFSQIRYAQCWEDADVLLDALDVHEGDVCLSIASAGDNSFSLLARNPAKVVAVDLNAAQLACVELRRAAYARLDHEEFLRLIGSRPCDRRDVLYQRCRPALPEDVQQFWDARSDAIAAGIGSAGKFERYFALFRERILPWIHSRRCVDTLLAGGSLEQRRAFYASQWNTWRWRLLFKVFFSRTVMGRFGRDPAFFKYVEGSVATRIFTRAEHALTELNPADNPYLQWILTGTDTTALPHALRLENFDMIRRNLDRLEVRLCSIEQYVADHPTQRFDRLNLSDIFEYMSEANYQSLLDLLVNHANAGARLVYWNMLVPRSRPAAMADHLRSLDELGDRLLRTDKAFFYNRLVVEEVIA